MLAQVSVALICVVAAGVAAGYHYGPERFWALALVEYLPYPVHLLPAGVALVLALWLGWIWRVAALLALALVIWIVMGLQLNRPDPGDGRLRVRVMTYNVKADLAQARPDGVAGLMREIARQAPDILLIQDGNSAFALDQPGPWPALPRYRYGHGQFLIASRYPLRDCGPGRISAQQTSDAWIECTIDIDGVAVDLFNAHLRTPRVGLNAARHEALDGVDDWEQNVADRLAQAADLARAIGSRTRPVVVGGDLNAPQPSLVVRTLGASGVRDAFASAGLGFGYTYGHRLRPGFSFLRIDHVLVSAQIGVAGCYAGGADASEHRPVIADLWVARREGTGLPRP